MGLIGGSRACLVEGMRVGEMALGHGALLLQGLASVDGVSVLWSGGTGL